MLGEFLHGETALKPSPDVQGAEGLRGPQPDAAPDVAFIYDAVAPLLLSR